MNLIAAIDGKGDRVNKEIADQIEDNEKKKEYLNGYKRICRKLESLEDQQTSIREVMQSAKIQSINDMPHGNKQTDLSDYIVKMDEIFTKIIIARGERLNLLADIESRIADMPDGIESDIIHKRYIEFKKWEEICVEINYSWRETHRKHSDALHNFSMA